MIGVEEERSSLKALPRSLSMVSAVSGPSSDPYAMLYSPQEMQNQVNNIGNQIQQDQDQWKESQEEMQANLPSLVDSTP